MTHTIEVLVNGQRMLVRRYDRDLTNMALRAIQREVDAVDGLAEIFGGLAFDDERSCPACAIDHHI